MRNYGFDYLVEKVQVLNEMAPKSKFWNTNFPEFMNFYLDVQDKMAKHPKAPPVSKTLADKRIEYISRMLFDFLSKDELAAIGIAKNKGFEPNVRNLAIRDLSPDEIIERRKIGDKRMREFTPGYAEFAGKWADNTPKQQDYMLSLMVRAYEEKALSKKFTSKVMDDANINAYFNKHLFKGGSSNFASGMINRKEELLGMDLGNFYEIQNKAKGIIQRLRKSKNIPKGLLMSIYHSERSLERQNTQLKKDDLFDLKIFKNTIEDLVEYRRDLVKNMSRMDFLSDEQNRLTDVDKSVFESMLNSINISIQNGQPIPKEQIEKIVPRVMGKVSDIVLKNYNQNYEFESTDDDAGLKADRYQTIYDSLDDDLLNHMIEQGNITPEEKEILKAWRNGASNLQQTIVSKSSRDAEKADQAQSREDIKNIRQGEYEKQAKKWEAEKKLKEKGVKKPKINIENEVAGLSAPEVEEKLREMMDVDDPDYEKINAVSKYLKKLKKNNPEDEENVMSYMTEQVYKDGFSDNTGKFVDRGFKKPKNYAHWLWLNEQ
jgi:hypothetical protein